mmetsp:Transcript_42181/g.91935  ORF Transcript_42181/g.91935 Transcript_42181/m.91935 type:complete len:87 (-) Transcript_42181:1628-1888(-)
MWSPVVKILRLGQGLSLKILNLIGKTGRNTLLLNRCSFSNCRRPAPKKRAMLSLKFQTFFGKEAAQFTPREHSKTNDSQHAKDRGG